MPEIPLPILATAVWDAVRDQELRTPKYLRPKNVERDAYLAEHPEARIQINTARLRKILPYERFMCAEPCSIIRGKARKGSDIDRGLVVLKSFLSQKRREKQN